VRVVQPNQLIWYIASFESGKWIRLTKSNASLAMLEPGEQVNVPLGLG